MELHPNADTERKRKAIALSNMVKQHNSTLNVQSQSFFIRKHFHGPGIVHPYRDGNEAAVTCPTFSRHRRGLFPLCVQLISQIIFPLAHMIILPSPNFSPNSVQGGFKLELKGSVEKYMDSVILFSHWNEITVVPASRRHQLESPVRGQQDPLSGLWSPRLGSKVHSFLQQTLMSADCMPGTGLRSGVTAENKTDKHSRSLFPAVEVDKE